MKTPRIWHLDNAEARARESSTFEIPARRVRETIAIGDVAKLVFLVDAKKPGGPAAERMWVEVQQVSGDGRGGIFYRGVLRNEPVSIEGLSAGDKVDFEPKHVADVSEAPWWS